VVPGNFLVVCRSRVALLDNCAGARSIHHDAPRPEEGCFFKLIVACLPARPYWGFPAASPARRKSGRATKGKDERGVGLRQA